MHPLASTGCLTLFASTVLLSIWEFISVRRLAWLRFTIGVVGIAGALLAAGWQWIHGGQIQIAMFTLDRFGSFFAVIILAATLIALLQTKGKLSRKQSSPMQSSDSYALILLGALGGLIAVYATDLIGIYLGFTGLILALAVWVGSSRNGWRLREVLLKHYFFAGLAALFLLYGTMLLYWGTGETSLSGIQAVMASRSLDHFESLGVVLVLAGVATTMTWFPFHFITFDFYAGGKTTSLGFLAVVGKLIGLTVFLRLVSAWWGLAGIAWHQLLIVVSVLTMSFGNLQALPEDNLKRRLAFGLVAQVGYMMLGLAGMGSETALNEPAFVAVAFYAAAYAVMTMGAFAVIVSLGNHGNTPLEVSDVIGVARQRPWLAASLALFLISLSGLPLTVGFIAKYNVLKVVIGSGSVTLGVIAVVNWVLSAYYYFDVIAAMYFKEPRERQYEPIGYPLVVAIFGCALITVYWGFFPSQISVITAESIRALLF